MPSIFPGMDPFIEGDDWEDFHTRYVTAIADALVPAVLLTTPFAPSEEFMLSILTRSLRF